MEPEITPEQKTQLATWVGKRDVLLFEISNLRDTKEKLEQNNKSIAESNTEIENRMNVVLGRIEELIKKEKELPLLISKDIASLQTQKSTLESDIQLLSSLVKVLTEQKESLRKDSAVALDVFNSFSDKAVELEKIIGRTTAIGSKNERVISGLVDSIKKGMEELVEKNNNAIKKTDDVVRDLPQVFLEVQRKSLSRKVINPKKI